MDSSNEIIYKANLHWISYIIPSILTLIGFVGILPAIFLRGLFQYFAILLVALFFKGIWMWLKNKFTRIYLSEDNITKITGVLNKNVSDIPLQKIENIYLFKPLLGKILGFGTVVVTTGEINQQYFIANPEPLRKILLEKTSLKK